MASILDTLAKTIVNSATSAVKTVVDKKKSNTMNLELEERAKQELPRHEKMVEMVLGREKEKWEEIEKFYIVNYYFGESLAGGYGNANFKILNEMPSKYRDTETYKTSLAKVLKMYKKFVSSSCRAKEMSTVTAFKVLSELETIPELNNELKYIFKHADYFVDEPTAAASVLTDKEDIGQYLNELKSIEFAEFIKDADIYMKYAVDGMNYVEQEDYDKAVEAFLFVDKERNYILKIKENLLYLALENEKDETNVVLYDTYKKICRLSFGYSTVREENDEKKAVILPCVDIMIADAIRCTKSNTTDQFKIELEKWLDECGKWMTSDQYEVLQKVFVYLKAYNLEMTLLNKMVTLDLPRTLEQEKRLAFLKNSSSIDSSQIISNTVYNRKLSIGNKEEVLYDHRFLAWGTSEIQGYFNSLTLNNQRHIVPIVVDEWNKDVSIVGVQWDCVSIIEQVKNIIEGSFGDTLKCSIVESGASVAGWVDTIPSIYIEPTETARQRELSFVLTGDQLTTSQTHFTIMVLLTSVSVADIHDHNQAFGAKIIAIKEKHNPRVEAYINTVKNILIEEIAAWANGINNMQDIY